MICYILDYFLLLHQSIFSAGKRTQSAVFFTTFSFIMGSVNGRMIQIMPNRRFQNLLVAVGS